MDEAEKVELTALVRSALLDELAMDDDLDDDDESDLMSLVNRAVGVFAEWDRGRHDTRS